MLDNRVVIAYTLGVERCSESGLGTTWINISISGASSWALLFLDLG